MTKEMEAAKSNINFKRRVWKASLGLLRVINDDAAHETELKF
jgi:hypothetical protein